MNAQATANALHELNERARALCGHATQIAESKDLVAAVKLAEDAESLARSIMQAKAAHAVVSQVEHFTRVRDGHMSAVVAYKLRGDATRANAELKKAYHADRMRTACAAGHIRVSNRPKPVKLGSLDDLAFFDEIGKFVQGAVATVTGAVNAVVNVVAPPPAPKTSTTSAKGSSQGTSTAELGKWEQFCDANFTGDVRAKCRTKFCAVFNPFAPGDCRADPMLLAAPWTDVGAGARGIPKKDPGVFYTVVSATKLPELHELEPDALYRTTLVDPIRARVLAGYLAIIPGVNGAMLASGVLPMLVAGGPAALTALAPIAIPYALAKGGKARLEERIIAPTIDFAGDMAPALLQVATGNVGVAVVQFAAKRAAKAINGQDEVSRTVKALIEVIGSDAERILAAAKALPQSLREAGTWNTLGNTLLRGADAAPASDAARIVRLLGTLFETFDQSIAALANGNPDDALNKSTVKLFGAELRVLQKLTPEQRNDLASAQNHTHRLQALADGTTILSNAFDSISRAANGIQFFGGLPQGIANLASGMRDVMTNLRSRIEAMAVDPNAKPPPVVTSTTRGLRTVSTFTRPSRTAMIALKPQLAAKPKPTAGSFAAPMAAGAAAGALVGGPPGAVVGAGAGLLLASLKKGK